MRAKGMKMGGAESFEHVQKPATAIQDHVSSQTVFLRSDKLALLRQKRRV